MHRMRCDQSVVCSCNISKHYTAVAVGKNEPTVACVKETLRVKTLPY